MPPKEIIFLNEGIELLIENNLDFFNDVANLKPILQKYADDLVRIIDRAPKLTSPLVVYRGFQSEEHLEGLTFVNKDFMSTSLDIYTAIQFATVNKSAYNFNADRAPKYFGGVYEIKINPGVPCIFMGFVSNLPEEYEVLLPPGLKFTFDSKIYYKQLPGNKDPFQSTKIVAIVHVTVDLMDPIAENVKGGRRRRRTLRR